jgi:hypothetical protein
MIVSMPKMFANQPLAKPSALALRRDQAVQVVGHARDVTTPMPIRMVVPPRPALSPKAHEGAEEMSFPRMQRVRQRFDGPRP